MTSKKTFLAASMVVLAAGLAAAPAQAQQKIKVGLMLPYTGTFAALGTAIENGFRLYLTEQGGKLAGREVEFVKVDDESDPAWAPSSLAASSRCCPSAAR